MNLYKLGKLKIFLPCNPCHYWIKNTTENFDVKINSKMDYISVGQKNKQFKTKGGSSRTKG